MDQFIWHLYARRKDCSRNVSLFTYNKCSISCIQRESIITFFGLAWKEGDHMDGRTEMFNNFVIEILGFFLQKREMSTFVGLAVEGIWKLDVISSFSSVSLILNAVVTNPKHDGTADVRFLQNKQLKTNNRQISPSSPQMPFALFI